MGVTLGPGKVGYPEGVFVPVGVTVLVCVGVIPVGLAVLVIVLVRVATGVVITAFAGFDLVKYTAGAIHTHIISSVATPIINSFCFSVVRLRWISSGISIGFVPGGAVINLGIGYPMTGINFLTSI